MIKIIVIFVSIQWFEWFDDGVVRLSLTLKEDWEMCFFGFTVPKHGFSLFMYLCTSFSKSSGEEYSYVIYTCLISKLNVSKYVIFYFLSSTWEFLFNEENVMCKWF